MLFVSKKILFSSLSLLVTLSLFSIYFTQTKVQAAGTTYYVATNGNDSNPGTSADPYKTIQKASNSVTAGDTVIVKPGTYSERVTVNNSGVLGSMITFEAEGEVITEGFTVNGDYIRIKGFTATSTSCDKVDGNGFYIRGDFCMIENNYVHNNPWYGIYTVDNSNNCEIQNNDVHRNVEAGIVIIGNDHLIESNNIRGTIESNPSCSLRGDADGIRFFGTGHRFRGNYIHDISFDDPLVIDAHIDCFQTWEGLPWWPRAKDIIIEKNKCEVLTYNDTDDHGAGFMLGDAENITIRNNIIQGPRGVNEGGWGTDPNNGIFIYNNVFRSDLPFPIQDHWPIAIAMGSNNVVVKNNIFYDFNSNIISAESGATNHDYSNNIAYRSDGVRPTLNACNPGCTIVDPKFVNPAMEDFHLQSNSPAIDAGAYLSSVTDDFENSPRPQGTGYDIGAFEYGSASPPPTSGPSPSPTPTPSILPSLSFEAESGTISSPFTITNGYVYQIVETDEVSGGRASYTFNISQAGDYIINTMVDAANTGRDSFFVNIDAEPTNPDMIWDITPSTTGFEQRTVSGRGNGTFDNNQFIPKKFTLTQGNHQLIIRGRESYTLLDSISIKLYQTPLLGDLDGDSDVDIFDYNILVSNFSASNCGNQADIDSDCDVDIFDYNTLVSNFGQ